MGFTQGGNPCLTALLDRVEEGRRRRRDTPSLTPTETMTSVSEPSRKHNRAARDIKSQMARPYNGRYHYRRARIVTYVTSIERGGEEKPAVLVDAEDHVEKDTLKAALGDRFAGRNYTETPGQRKRTVVYLSL